MSSIFKRTFNRLRRDLLPAYHARGAFWCPVCCHAVRRFDPLPPNWHGLWNMHGFDLAPGRFETLNLEEAYCPLCFATDRDRLYALYLEGVLTKAPESGGRFIDFAPVSALHARIRQLLGGGWALRTADLMMPGVDDRVDLCDMHAVYADESVDMFVCSHVLEHVADDLQALRELLRILKPGGKGILMVPIHLDLEQSREGPALANDEERWRRYGQGDHERLHSKADFMERVSSAGFTLETLGQEHFGARTFEHCGISPQSVLYVGHKRA